MLTRRITPSQLSLFSISPVIGAWREELKPQNLFESSKPEVKKYLLRVRLTHQVGNYLTKQPKAAI